MRSRLFIQQTGPGCLARGGEGRAAEPAPALWRPSCWEGKGRCKEDSLRWGEQDHRLPDGRGDHGARCSVLGVDTA